MIRRGWAVLAGLYGVDIILAQPEPGATWAGIALLVGAAATWISRLGPAVLALAALLALLGPATSTETAFVMWGSGAIALFDGDELRTALRWQVGIVYLFAAANKLSAAFLSGSILAFYMPWFPAPSLLAPAAVVTELALGIAVLLRVPNAVWFVAGFHATIAVLLGDAARHVLSLFTYGAMMAFAVYVANGVTAPGRVRVVVDGDCGICTHSALWLRRLDWRHRLDIEASTGLDAMLAEDATGLHAGGRAWTVVAREVPLLLPVWVLGCIPGVRRLVDAGYELVARNRHRISVRLGMSACAVR